MLKQRSRPTTEARLSERAYLGLLVLFAKNPWAGRMVMVLCGMLYGLLVALAAGIGALLVCVTLGLSAHLYLHAFVAVTIFSAVLAIRRTLSVYKWVRSNGYS